MTIHHSSGGSKAGLGGSLPGFRSCASGSWTIVARPEYVEHARSFLAPLPVESLLAAFETQLSMRDEGGGDPLSGVDTSPGDVRSGPKDSGARAGARRPSPSRGRMATLEVDCGEGTTLVVKALRRGGLPARLRGGYHGSSRLLTEMAILEEALRREIPTARLAFGATGRRESGSEVAILATEMIPGAVALGDLLSGTAPPPGPAAAPARRRADAAPAACDPRRVPQEREAMLARRAALRAAGAAVGKAHELGLDHADLNLGNILVRSGGAWSGFVIDLGLSALGPALDFRRRAANLVRLLRSVEKHLGDDPRRVRDAAAFVRGYLSTIPAARRRRRRDLLTAVRRGLPSILVHRLGWSLLGRRGKRS